MPGAVLSWESLEVCKMNLWQADWYRDSVISINPIHPIYRFEHCHDVLGIFLLRILCALEYNWCTYNIRGGYCGDVFLCAGESFIATAWLINVTRVRGLQKYPWYVCIVSSFRTCLLVDMHLALLKSVCVVPACLHLCKVIQIVVNVAFCVCKSSLNQC